MKRSLRPIPVSAPPALALAASTSTQRSGVALSAGTQTPPGPPSGMSHVTAQSLLTYLRGCGVCDACAIELISSCARRARDAN
jgi:hypothetical protein